MTKDNLETLVARRLRIICDEQIEDLEGTMSDEQKINEEALGRTLTALE